MKPTSLAYLDARRGAGPRHRPTSSRSSSRSGAREATRERSRPPAASTGSAAGSRSAFARALLRAAHAHRLAARAASSSGAFLVADPLIALNSAINGVWCGRVVGARLSCCCCRSSSGARSAATSAPPGALIEWLDAEHRARAALSPAARGRLRRAARIRAARLAGGLALFASGGFLLFDPLATLTRTATVLLYPLLDRLVAAARRRALPRASRCASRHRPDHRRAHRAPDLRASPSSTASSSSCSAMFARDARAVVARAAPVVPPPVPARRAARRCRAGSRCVGRVVDAEKLHQLRPVRAGLPARRGLATTTWPPTPRAASSARVRRRLPHRRDRVGHAPVAPALHARPGGRPHRRRRSRRSRASSPTRASRATRDPRLIRPPGGPAENDLLALCTRCGQCMKVCPTNVLQPAVSAAGVEGVFTPQMDYHVGSVRVVVQRVRQGLPDRRDHAAHARSQAQDRDRPRLHRQEPLHPLGRRTRPASCARSSARYPTRRSSSTRPRWSTPGRRAVELGRPR